MSIPLHAMKSFIPIESRGPRGQYLKSCVGLKFNKLTVIEQYMKFNGHFNITHFKCQCDCGNIIESSASSIRTDHTKSCGCIKKENCGKFQRKEYMESSFNSLFLTYKKGATKSNRTFQLTKEQFKILTSSNCHYCGIEPQQSHYKPDFHGSYVYNGIDRIDNNIGYILSNCVTACKMCNFAKRDISKSQWDDWITRIIKHNDNFDN